MNGEIKELFTEIDKRFTVHEALQDQWQKEHDKNSQARTDKASTDILSVKLKIDQLEKKMMCDVHKEKMDWITLSLNTLWGVIIVTCLIQGFFWFKNGG